MSYNNSMNKNKLNQVYIFLFPDEKLYVGVCSDYKERIRTHKKGQLAVDKEIRKVGWHNVRHSIIATYDSIEECGQLEKELVDLYDTTNPKKGWNRKSGGIRKCGHTLETKKLMSELKKGYRNPFYGKKHTAESNYKRSLYRGEKHPLFGTKQPHLIKRNKKYGAEIQNGIRKRKGHIFNGINIASDAPLYILIKNISLKSKSYLNYAAKKQKELRIKHDMKLIGDLCQA